jgi:hypothetical protein
MSHTLHRRGVPGFTNDFILFAMSAKGVNEVGAHAKLKRFLEIIRDFKPVNIGDMKTGNRFIALPDYIVNNAQDTSIVHGVFDSRENLIKALKAVKEADLGVSVIVSGLLHDVSECCSAAEIKPHTCETSLGIWGQTKRLPDEDILRVTTMCGHGQVSFNLVTKIIEDVKTGKRTLQQGAEELAKPCQCGVFNPARAVTLLQEICCLWGVRTA